MTTLIERTAALLLHDATELGFDPEQFKAHLDDIGEDGLEVIDDAVAASRNSGQRKWDEEFFDSEIAAHLIGTVAALLEVMGSQAFLSHLPHLKPLMIACTDSLVGYDRDYFRGNPLNISKLLHEVLSYKPFTDVLHEINSAKLRTVFNTLMDQLVTGPAEHGVQDILAVIVPVLHIETMSDAKKMDASNIAYNFRFHYIRGVFPYPDSNQYYRYRYPDSTIDKMAAVYERRHTRKIGSSYACSAEDFNKFITNKPNSAAVDEAFSFLHLIGEIEPHHWDPILNMLRLTPGVTHSTDYSRETSAVRSHCEALITVFRELCQLPMRELLDIESLKFIKGDTSILVNGGMPMDGWQLTDRRLVDHLKEYPENALVIADFVKERKTFNWDVLSVAVDNKGVLQNGAL